MKLAMGYLRFAHKALPYVLFYFGLSSLLAMSLAENAMVGAFLSSIVGGAWLFVRYINAGDDKY